MAQSTLTSPPTTPQPAQAKRRWQRPPGPPWYTAIWNTLNWRDPLAFLRGLRASYGDLITLPTVVGPLTLVFHPDGVRHVVQENHFNYHKGDIYQVLSLTLGKGLLTNNGDSWLHQRRLIQPIFHRKQIAAFGRLMTENATSWIESLNLDTGAPLDVFQEMSGLTLSVVCQALFGADMLPYKQRVFTASSTINHLDAQAFSAPWLLTLPTPQRRRLYKAKATLDAIVDTLISRRRSQATASRNDLLAMLLEARDAETGEGMADQQVSDEVRTLMLAGHETTTNALCWTLLLLAQHPDIEARLREEYTRVLGERAVRLEDLSQLPYARMVLEESMRLYPPAWMFARRALDKDEIDGYRIAKGTNVLLVPAVTHQHPDFWEQPEVFDPERFKPEHASERHRFAYFPFGGGPRVCIGNQFALTEAQLVLATILPRLQFRLLPGTKVVPDPLVTLRPRDGLWMTVQKKETSL